MVLVIVERVSKFTVMFPACNSTAKTTLNLLHRGLFSYFGYPKSIVTDWIMF